MGISSEKETVSETCYDQVRLFTVTDFSLFSVTDLFTYSVLAVERHQIEKMQHFSDFTLGTS